MLLSKLWTFPNAWIKKSDITDVHSELFRIYKWLVRSSTFFNSDMMYSALNWQKEQAKEQKIYSPEAYKSELLEKFWTSKSITVILNDQIGDSILTVPLLISLQSLGKPLHIYWKNAGVIQRILGEVNIEYTSFDFKNDTVGTSTDDFCINIHRVYQRKEPPRWQYLSLDWRMLPLFDANLYSFPARFASLVEILFWYKNLSPKDTRTVETNERKRNVLFVPFSSIPDKEIPQKQWIDVLSHMKVQNPDADFLMVNNYKPSETGGKKYIEIAETMERLKFRVKVICLSLEELYDFLVEERPYVISSDTWVAHLTSAVGLKTNILFSHWNYEFWSFGYDTVRRIPTILSRYLRLTGYGLFDPAWKNTELDPNFQPFLNKNIFDTPYIIRSLLE